MRRRFLNFIGIFIFRQAWWLAPLVIAMTALAAWVVYQSTFDTRLVDFLPNTRVRERIIREIVGDYQTLEPVTVIIRHKQPGHEADLRAAAQEFSNTLDKRYFARAVYRVDELAQSYYQSLSDLRIIQLLTDEDWERLRQAMSDRYSADRLKLLKAYRLNALAPASFQNISPQDPLGALDLIREQLAYSRGPTRLTPRDGYFLSPDGSAILLLAYPLQSADDGHYAMRAYRSIVHTIEDLYKRNRSWNDQMTFDYAGSHVTIARHIEQMQHELGIIIKLSIPMTLLLILLVFRKVEAVLFILLPPTMGLLWAQAITYHAVGSTSALTFAFLLVITAIGGQYCIHLYHRFTVELYTNQNYYRALRRAYAETARGLLASGLGVALLFGFLALTSLWGVHDPETALRALREGRGFAQLGIVAAIGVICQLAACLIVMPIMAAVKHRLAKGRVKPVELFRFGLERLYEPAITSPRSMLGAMLFVCVFLGWQARGLDFDSTFASISGFFFNSEQSATAEDPAFPRPGRPIVAVVEGDTLQEALERNDQLHQNLQSIRRYGGEAEYNLLAFDSLRTVLPSLRSQQQSLGQLKQLDLKPLRRTIERASREAGFKPTVCEPFLKTLEDFKRQAAHPRYIDWNIEESDAFIANVQRYVHHEGRKYYVATAIYPHAAGFRPDRLTMMTRRMAAGIDRITFIGDPLIERELSRMVRFNLALMILLSIVIIFTVLLLHFRRMRLVWLTFLPTVAEIIWFGGAMGLADLHIHFFTVLAMPLVLSLAMDNSLQLAQYYEDRRPCSMRQTMRAVGRVSVLTCGVMALVFGTLAVASYPGVRDFGLAVLLGALSVMAGSVMLQPALLQLLGREQPLLSVFDIEPDSDSEENKTE
ncbi:MMPL family transporter [bacterium]|nr:MMPL family transporter [bacterium]